MENLPMYTSYFKSALGRRLFEEVISAPWQTTSVKGVEQFDCAVGVHAGVKRKRNEDRTILARVELSDGEALTVAAVCDGVGGSSQGDEAATIAIVKLVEQLSQLKASTPIPPLLKRLLRGMDEAVLDALGGNGTTTASVLIVSSSGNFAAANIGDSRIFSWRSGYGILQVSVDDTLENELRELDLIDASVLDARGMRGSLSQALGEAGRHSSELRIAILGPDRFRESGIVLASDGAWKGSESAFRALAKNAANPVELVRRVLAVATWCGDLDNASIIAIKDVQALARETSRLGTNRKSIPTVTVWICDSKIVITGTHQEGPSNWLNVGEQLEAKSMTKKPARPRKRKDESNRQMSLKPEGVASKKKDSLRPVVQVSSDDEIPTKR